MMRRIGNGMIAGAVALFVLYFVITGLTAPGMAAERQTADDSTLVGAMGAGFDGTVTMHDGDGEAVWQHSGAVSYNDVTRINESHVLTTFQTEPEEECGNLDTPCARTGVKILDTTSGQPSPVWEWSFAVQTGRNSEVHDAEPLPNGNILAVDMDRERVVIVNRTTKAIEWQWNASSHYERPSDPRFTDWLHMNDVDRIGDGRYLISVRNANQLLIVERGEGVVDVINRDRGDPNDDICRGLQKNQMAVEDPKCGSSDILYHQHNPQWLGEGAVLVADSENDRVVELHKRGGNWTVAWAAYSANSIRFDWPRDADRLENGNTLVTDTRNNRVVEIEKDGDVVWTTTVAEQSYDADRGGREYPAGEPYNASGMVIGTGSAQPLGIIDAAYGAIRHLITLPHWVTSWHVFVLFVSAVMTVYGVALRQIAARRMPEQTERPSGGSPADD